MKKKLEKEDHSKKIPAFGKYCLSKTIDDEGTLGKGLVKIEK
jgi:hypothetical protein